VGVLRKSLNVTVLGLAMAFSVLLGAVFPIPPWLLLARRRRTDPIELVLPAVAGTGLDLSQPLVPAELLDRSA
jgi:hypothetical protein